MIGKNCGRTLRNNRKEYKKPKTTRFKYFPTIKGTVVSYLEKEARQPSSGIRACWRISCGKKGILIAYSPYDGLRDLIKIHDTVTIESQGGRKGGSMGDIPGVRFRIVKVGKTSCRQLFLGRQSV